MSSTLVQGALADLTNTLGAPVSVVYADGSIMGKFPERDPAGLDAALASMGVSVEHSVDLPTAPKTAIRVGKMAGMLFHVETHPGAPCTVRLYPAKRENGRPSNPWAAEHDLMDAALARCSEPRNALLAYLEAQLMRGDDHARQLAADMTHIVAGFLRGRH